MAEITVGICEITAFLLQGYCLQSFFGSFLESRLPARRTGGIAVAVCYGMMKAAVVYLTPVSTNSTDGIISLYCSALCCRFLFSPFTGRQGPSLFSCWRLFWH